jgi:hypothetical protein
MMCTMLFADVILVSLGVVMTCMALTRFRKDLTETRIQLNFMQIREQHLQEEVIQYRHEVWRLMGELRYGKNHPRLAE